MCGHSSFRLVSSVFDYGKKMRENTKKEMQKGFSKLPPKDKGPNPTICSLFFV